MTNLQGGAERGGHILSLSRSSLTSDYERNIKEVSKGVYVIYIGRARRV